jgi:hypothetical protein
MRRRPTLHYRELRCVPRVPIEDGRTLAVHLEWSLLDYAL